MEKFSDNAEYWLKQLGHFRVTNAGDEIKGWALLDDFEEYERVYFDAKDLRQLASAMIEVAEFLENKE